MNYLVVYAHPNPQSFNAAVRDRLVQRLKSRNNPVVVRDLYQLAFNPVLSGKDFSAFLQGATPVDIQAEQDAVRKSDVLIFVCPVWWFNMPAILRGYVDRVFSRGFAYDFIDGSVKGLLSGKKAVIINTTGGPQQAYEQFGYRNAIKTTVDDGIFAFCGMDVVLHKYFYEVPTVSDEARKGMLAELETLDL